MEKYSYVNTIKWIGHTSSYTVHCTVLYYLVTVWHSSLQPSTMGVSLLYTTVPGLYRSIFCHQRGKGSRTLQYTTEPVQVPQHLPPTGQRACFSLQSYFRVPRSTDDVTLRHSRLALTTHLINLLSCSYWLTSYVVTVFCYFVLVRPLHRCSQMLRYCMIL